MKRRDFLAGFAAASLLSRAVRAEELPDDLRVTRVTGFNVVSQRSKVAGKNSRLDVHGDKATDRMLRIETNQGLTGVGNCRADEEAAAKLLGQHPFAGYQSDVPAFRGPLGPGTMPLWDLLGHVRNTPAYQLLGGRGIERVPCYDGSIYFADLLPQYADRWEDRFREEIDMGLAIGHRAFKVKIGRGSKWMPRAEGDARDAAILRIIRDHAGPDVLIGIDANNGYTLAGTKRLFEKIGELNIAFAEEMFEETVEECLAFQEFLRENGWQTLVADGETQSDLDAFRPFIEQRSIQVYQGDMNRFGFEGILKEAGWCEEQDLRVAPHNWGSLVGFYMQLHVGRAIPNFFRAEHDPLSNRVLASPGYTIREGVAEVPEVPGFGISIDERRFASDAEIRFDRRV